MSQISKRRRLEPGLASNERRVSDLEVAVAQMGGGGSLMDGCRVKGTSKNFTGFGNATHTFALIEDPVFGFDPSGWRQSGNLVVPQAGFYQVSAQVIWTETVGSMNTTYTLQVVCAGTVFGRDAVQPGEGGLPIQQGVSVAAPLEEGQTLQCKVIQDAGGEPTTCGLESFSVIGYVYPDAANTVGE